MVKFRELNTWLRLGTDSKTVIGGIFGGREIASSILRCKITGKVVVVQRSMKMKNSNSNDSNVNDNNKRLIIIVAAGVEQVHGGSREPQMQTPKIQTPQL